MFLKILLNYILGYVNIKVEGFFIERFSKYLYKQENITMEYEKRKINNIICKYWNTRL